MVVHWHDKDKVRAWGYAFPTQGAYSADTSYARILSTPSQNIFCSGHVNLFDGRLLIAGGTAPGTAGELGTTEVVTFDPSQPNLWTTGNHWAVQDTMALDRWYPTVTHMGDGSLLVNSGVEFFEMPVIGGSSPQDASTPFREFRPLGLGRFPKWPMEAMNLDAPYVAFPQVTDHTAIKTGQQQFRKDGRGVIVTFGGLNGAGAPGDTTWMSWDVAVDAHNSWRTELLPLSSGSPRPPARSQHGAAIEETSTGLGSYELKLFVFGGLAANGTALGDVWRLKKPDNNSPGTWQQITAGGDVPLPRYGHTMVFDAGATPGIIPAFPPVGGLPRQYYPKLFVFGGKLDSQTWASTDTVFVLQLWEPYTWHAMVLSSPKPGPRYRHAATFDRRKFPSQTRFRMSIFGGAGPSVGGADSPLLNDTWTLSRGEQDTMYAGWQWAQNTAGTAPPAVYKHSMIHDEEWNRLLVFGGDRTSEGPTAETNTGGETNESYVRPMDIFVTDTGWSLKPTQSPITRRSGHSAVYYWGKAVNARIPERFSPLADSGQRWSPLTASPKFDRETYPFMFALPDGRLFYSGRGDTSEVLAAAPTGPWGQAALAAVSDTALIGEGGTAVQYLPGRVLKVGSNGKQGWGNIATFTGSSYAWSDADNDQLLARGNPNSTILPTGQVLVTGGREWKLPNQSGSNFNPPVKIPQAWTPPPSESWTRDATALAEEPANRGYHSTAILLPDARVLSAGGETGAPTDHFQLGTIFEPPYLFDPASSGGNGYATRPTIDTAPKLVAHGCPFSVSVTSSSGVSGVCLIRPGAVTHAFNQDQRYVPLSFTSSGGALTVDGPVDAHTAPPGDYLLFVLDNTSGKVPSVARWVRVTESIGPYQASDDTIPGRTLSLSGSNGFLGTDCTQPVTASWYAPSDDSNRTSSGRVRALDLRYSTSSICDNCWSAFGSATQVECEPPAAAPGSYQSIDIAGLEIGAYQFRMVSQDDKSATGNRSAMSNAKTLYVYGCESEGFYAGGGGGGNGMVAARSAGLSALAGASALGSGENSALAPSGGAAVTDVLRLTDPRIVDGRLQVRLRRGATGSTHVSSVALVAVDHAHDTEVFRVAGEWLAARREPGIQAVGSHGEELRSLLSGDPSACFVGDTEDTLTIQLSDAAPGAAAGILYLDAQAGRTRDGEESAIRVLELGADGSSREVGRVHPRARFSTLALAGTTRSSLKLVFSGNHALTRAGRLTATSTPDTTRLAMAAVRHSRFGSLESAALAPDGTGVTLSALDTMEVQFDLAGTAPSGARDWFLLLTGSSTGSGVLASRAGPSVVDVTVPAQLHFDSPSPNPFFGETRLRFGLPQGAYVQLEVFDLAGRRVATVARGPMAAGWHSLAWNGASRSGGHVAAGIYVCRLSVGARSLERKMVVMP